MLDSIDKKLLQEVADLHDIPQGAYNIRKNGEKLSRNTTANIDIITKDDKPGIDVIIKPGTKNESVHIPVILSENMEDLVYNTFEIGEDSDVTIVAGCGIHNSTSKDSGHDGVHEFFIRRGARVKYVEKHYGQGEGTGKRLLNPVTIAELEEGAQCEMEMVQIKGVDSTARDTKAYLKAGAKLVVTERLMTHGAQYARSDLEVNLLGGDSSAQIVSRSVARDNSEQVFYPRAVGGSRCRAHVQCDSIIMDSAKVRSIPEIAANHAEAQIVHEAAIGRINNDQLLKLMTFGMDEGDAEDVIIRGFLK